MEVIYPRCCGLDVHKREVVAYMVRTEPDGTVLKEVRAFGAITPDILVLADWLAAHEVSHVAMESTGVYRSTATGSPRTGRAVPPPHLRRRQPQLARGRIQTDLSQFAHFLGETNCTIITPADIRRADIAEYLSHLADQGISGNTRARKLAAI